MQSFRLMLAVGMTGFIAAGQAAAPPAPRFSVANMDRSVSPGTNFFQYADGTWVKDNPVPPDKSRWTSFDELQQRNWYLIHGILRQSASDRATEDPVERQVGDFFASAMNTNRLEQLGFRPLEPELQRIAAIDNRTDLARVLAGLQLRDVGALFNVSGDPDEKDSSIYAFHLAQGGLGLPDRDYYLSPDFAKQRAAYRTHIAKMFGLAGDSASEATNAATVILKLETALAKASSSRVELRDPVANYHKLTVTELEQKAPGFAWAAYVQALGIPEPAYVIVGQPAFFAAESQLLKAQPLADWKTYLRWDLIRAAAPYLDKAAEDAHFAFYGTVLRGQPKPEPRWQRAAHTLDESLGEAVGKLYCAKYFPPAAQARMNALVENLKAVFHDRLEKVPWMTPATRAKALVKFSHFTQKIGHPAKFRDYSKVIIRRDDYLGNVWRAAEFESRRELDRIGKPVDRSEWEMTPQTVNAYFNPLMNEIVFPAGILQPPFFDMHACDAVNYGAIGVVIGHEMTHGYDDEGRQFDAKGNLKDWWTPQDAKAFKARAQKLVNQFDAYEPLPGVHVNGKLTLGENIADLGGASIAFEALERDLAKHPDRRKKVDGFTPEQLFFLSLAQVWRVNCRPAELRRRLTVDPHAPPQYRAIGAAVNMPQFYQAFDIKPGDPMWRPPALRAKIW